VDYAAPPPRPAPWQAQPYLIREQRHESALEFLNRYLIKEEVHLTMNKLSLMALLSGLMFLGALFFVSGFLVAVNVYTPSTPTAIPEMPHNPLARPSHAPSHNPNAAVTTASATLAATRPQYIVPPQYATVDGITIVQQPRLPSPQQAAMMASNPHTLYTTQPPTHMPAAGVVEAPRGFIPSSPAGTPPHAYPYTPANPVPAPVNQSAPPGAYIIPQYAAPARARGY
jgi:hypothetical protein